MMSISPCVLVLVLLPAMGIAFTPVLKPFLPVHAQNLSRSLSSQDQEWSGEVVSNTEKGAIKGSKLRQDTDSLTTWSVAIDGVEADLGKFSEAIHRKIIKDVRQQRFQGFRPGTFPPQLERTYKLFAMDEAAREATLEALQQNNIRPFDESRSELLIETISIPPPKKKKPKKKKGKRKKKGAAIAEQPSENNNEESVKEVEPIEDNKWLTFSTMKEAVAAGWNPGQSFSFISTNVKGQKLAKKEEPTSENVLFPPT